MTKADEISEEMKQILKEAELLLTRAYLQGKEEGLALSREIYRKVYGGKEESTK